MGCLGLPISADNPVLCLCSLMLVVVWGSLVWVCWFVGFCTLLLLDVALEGGFFWGVCLKFRLVLRHVYAWPSFVVVCCKPYFLFVYLSLMIIFGCGWLLFRVCCESHACFCVL